MLVIGWGLFLAYNLFLAGYLFKILIGDNLDLRINQALIFVSINCILSIANIVSCHSLSPFALFTILLYPIITYTFLVFIKLLGYKTIHYCLLSKTICYSVLFITLVLSLGLSAFYISSNYVTLSPEITNMVSFHNLYSYIKTMPSAINLLVLHAFVIIGILVSFDFIERKRRNYLINFISIFVMASYTIMILCPISNIYIFYILRLLCFLTINVYFYKEFKSIVISYKGKDTRVKEIYHIVKNMNMNLSTKEKYQMTLITRMFNSDEKLKENCYKMFGKKLRNKFEALSNANPSIEAPEI